MANLVRQTKLCFLQQQSPTLSLRVNNAGIKGKQAGKSPRLFSFFLVIPSGIQFLCHSERSSLNPYTLANPQSEELFKTNLLNIHLPQFKPLIRHGKQKK